MNKDLIERVGEEWAQLDPVDPLRGLLSDVIDVLAQTEVMQEAVADEREDILNLVQKMAARFYKDDAEKAFEELTEAIRARGNT